MISHIHIRDFAIINELDVDFHAGFNVITGETGAGKSIIIEAVSLALGSRADTAFIRSGKEKAIIELVLDGKNEKVSSLLKENGLEEEEQLIIRREITANGKSTCRINGSLVSVSFLNKLCKYEADIHGQYDHQSLLNPELHITLLDLYDEANIFPAKETVASLFSEYNKVKQTLSALSRSEKDAKRKHDFMQFELQEITAANLSVNEDEELQERITLLQNSERIYQNLSSAYALLCNDAPSALDGLGKSKQKLEEITLFSKEISEFTEQLSDCYYKIEDLSSQIRHYIDDISFSEQELDEALNRMDEIDALKRKYGNSIEEILEYQIQLQENLELIEDTDQKKETLTQQLSILEKELLTASQTLSSLRKVAAKKMETSINQELTELNFNDAKLSISFKVQETQKEPSFTSEGIDQIEFLISTNKGEAEKPLAKIASGGEISRIMLAFKRIVGELDSIPTMIFDEIDSGISGITASIVGKKLLQIAQNHQIICITHLPQIAAFGQYHYQIQKTTENDITQTTVLPLSHEEKVKEIARLLGGINITDTTIKSAEELLALSQN